ncbi:Gfo/Idh/MocA family protein [Tropicimonas marinistellae]|uniref:Gfo/Idh/MocA family protein n=1 Tax=Tropicimonas marinistellae TaxID=1739787 RepID=UPI00083443EE|nr:Gfo/Idh/MocA family oxidoreductase [Tropicimonas marinistellae]
MNWRWGILATGNIAGSMAEALAQVPGAERLAVASRDLTKAEDFAQKWGVQRAYGSYEALQADSDVDVVYVATPNALHPENVLACLEAGKHVLCEKPMTSSSADTQLCVETARGKGLFLMEAMWTRFLPALKQAKAVIAEGRIGEPFLIRANAVVWRDPLNWPNLFNPALGGGAMLDLGVYPLAVAQYLMGDIVRAEAEMCRGETGVDILSLLNVRFASGTLGQLSCGFAGDMPVVSEVFGSKGHIRISPPLYRPTRIEIVAEGTSEILDLEPDGNGYAHEVVEVQRCLDAGLTESPAMPLSQSIDTARIIEDLLAGRRFAKRA